MGFFCSDISCLSVTKRGDADYLSQTTSRLPLRPGNHDNNGPHAHLGDSKTILVYTSNRSLSLDHEIHEMKSSRPLAGRCLSRRLHNVGWQHDETTCYQLEVGCSTLPVLGSGWYQSLAFLSQVYMHLFAAHIYYMLFFYHL
jgi:hypothetical protein